MPTKRPQKAKPVDADSQLVVAVDEHLVQEAVHEISRILHDTLYKAVTGVGDYVLRVFFRNDPALVSSKDPHKNASFRALAERCGSDLPIPKSWLHNAVGVAVMRRTLPEAAHYKLLSPSHQAALLPLRTDPLTAEKLARRAVDKRLSVRDLREEVIGAVERAREDTGPRGRPRKPTITKTLDRATKVFTLDGGRRSFTKALLDELDAAEVPRALKSARALLEQLQGLVEKLETRA